MKWRLGLLTTSILLVVTSAYAAILPGTIFHKFEANLDGFGYLKLMDPDGSPYYAARSVTKVRSPLRDQGLVPYVPYQFYTGDDNLPGYGAQYGVTGTLAFLTVGLKVIGIDKYTVVPGSPPSFTYTLITGDSNIVSTISSLAPNDIVYLGADPNSTLGTFGVFTWDPTVNPGDFVPGTDGWSQWGELFTSGSVDIGLGGVNDITILTTDFVKLDGLQVDSLQRAAMPGTLVAQVISVNGDVRPIFFMNVTGGVDAPWVVPGGMKATLGLDTDNDGWIDYDWSTNPPTPYTKTVVADIIANIGTQPASQSGWFTFSDPVEWVAQPEPTSLLVWGGLAGAGLLLARRRKNT